MIQPRL